MIMGDIFSSVIWRTFLKAQLLKWILIISRFVNKFLLPGPSPNSILIFSEFLLSCCIRERSGRIQLQGSEYTVQAPTRASGVHLARLCFNSLHFPSSWRLCYGTQFAFSDCFKSTEGRKMYIYYGKEIVSWDFFFNLNLQQFAREGSGWVEEWASEQEARMVCRKWGSGRNSEKRHLEQNHWPIVIWDFLGVFPLWWCHPGNRV